MSVEEYREGYVIFCLENGKQTDIDSFGSKFISCSYWMLPPLESSKFVSS